jgi:glycerophosphoryl diester phosphodiesterase
LSRSGPLDRWLAPAPEPARVAWLRGRVYAHRGLHGAGAVENSASAFAAAIDAGLGIECDVRPSADGEAVVFHDRELDRLTGASGPVAERRAAELARTELRGTRESILPLGEMLALIGGRVPLLIELKSERERPVAPLCRAVARALDRYSGHCAVMSFDPRIGRWFAVHAPDLVRGLVISESAARARSGAIARRLALWRARPEFLAYDVRDLGSPFAAAQRVRGLPLLTWTVTTAIQLERALRCADGYIAEADGLATVPPSA